MMVKGNKNKFGYILCITLIKNTKKEEFVIKIMLSVSIDILFILIKSIKAKIINVIIEKKETFSTLFTKTVKKVSNSK